MVNSMVERATSDMLIGPDWAMNVEICDMLNRDLTQSKDVVKSLKKRIRSKNPKVQLLALTLLETIIKNCGEVVHMHVAEKDVLHEMVKIAKKKPDFRVKEKILILIDTWQEAFGGARARYPQFYAAYHELVCAGAVFPPRTGSSYQPNTGPPEHRQDGTETSTEAEFPTLSLTEIQNARGIMDVLAEMLSALDPSNKEGLRQEVVIDLVEQCRTFKQRLVHLVNSTSDESLLRQGLALNDDLQRLLAKHEAMASGTLVETEKPKPESDGALVNLDVPLIDTGDSMQSDGGSITKDGSHVQLLVPASATDGPTIISTKTDPNIDLLSGDFNSPTDEITLAIVPVGESQSTSPISNPNNALALVDMFSQTSTNQPGSQSGQAYSTASQYQLQQNFQPSQGSVYPNDIGPNLMAPQFEQSQYNQVVNPGWNEQLPTQPQQQQQPPSPAYGAQPSSTLPLPPWEAQPTEDTQLEANQYPLPMQAPQPQHMPGGTHQGYHQPMGNGQVPGMYVQPVAMNNQAVGMYPQQMQPEQMAYMNPQQMYNNQMAGYGYGYGYGLQQNIQHMDQRISGLSLRDDSALRNSSRHPSTPSYVPPGKPMKAEDKLFGDLVDITKFKPAAKTTPSRTGSM